MFLYHIRYLPLELKISFFQVKKLYNENKNEEYLENLLL